MIYIIALVFPALAAGLIWLFVPAARKQRLMLVRAFVFVTGFALAIAIVTAKTPPPMTRWLLLPHYYLITMGAPGVWLQGGLYLVIVATGFVMARRDPPRWRNIVGRTGAVLGTVALLWTTFVRVR